MKEQDTSLVLRTCAPDMSSSYGFQWPDVGGIAEAPDWDPKPECGGGLHGWLYGHGDVACSYGTGECFSLPDSAKWLVLEVITQSIIDLGGKCKFPRATVVFVGDMTGATRFLIDREPRAGKAAVIGAEHCVGDNEYALVGGFGRATAGRKGHASAGHYGFASAGYLGVAIAGAQGTAMVGHGGTACAGYEGSATAGNDGIAFASVDGKAEAGDCGTAIVREGGTARAGHGGIATAGLGGTAAAGLGGEIRISYRDSTTRRYRTMIGYIGEGGIEPNVDYCLDTENRFERKRE